MFEEGGTVKTIEQILKEVAKNAEMKTQEEQAIGYLTKLREEIGKDICKLLVYKDMCNDETDFEFSTCVMSVCAVILSIMSVILTILSINQKPISEIGIELHIMFFSVIILFLYANVRYVSACIKKNKYSLIKSTLEQIDKELNK